MVHGKISLKHRSHVSGNTTKPDYCRNPKNPRLVKMKFCPECDNMMEARETTEKPVRAQYACTYCTHTESCIATESICVVDNNYNDKEARYKQYMTPYLKDDPTLPHVSTIPCPNKSCKSHDPSIEGDVLYVKYDVDDMRFIYQCQHCETYWRT